MIKNVIKEIGIAIMLLIAIALVLGIIFYEYIPNNKTVPIALKPYALSEDVQEELKESINQEGQNIIMIKYISNDELDVYESKKGGYNKGKANPFADYSNNETNNNTTQTSNNTTGNKNSTNTSSSTNNKIENTNQNEVYVSTSGKNWYYY